MFYLSKGITTLVNKMKRDPEAAQPVGSRLGFRVDAPEPQEEVERLGGVIPRAITRAGSEFAYVLGNEGVIMIPAATMQETIAKGKLGRSDSKAGVLRHYHIAFSDEGGTHQWVMKEGQKEDVESLFHKLK